MAEKHVGFWEGGEVGWNGMGGGRNEVVTGQGKRMDLEAAVPTESLPPSWD